MTPPAPDPTLKNARREATVIMLAWLACTVYCCTYCYLFGYGRPDRPRTTDDIHFVLGIPGWFFWGVIAPWAVCLVFNIVYAGFFMTDDDLGRDHAEELERDIREPLEEVA